MSLRRKSAPDHAAVAAAKSERKVLSDAAYWAKTPEEKEAAEAALAACAWQRVLDGTLTKEQIIKGEIPAYAAPEKSAPVEETWAGVSEAGKAWILAHGARWDKKESEVRYYLDDARAIVEMAGSEIDEERKGQIEKIDGLSKSKTARALAGLAGLYYEAVEGRFHWKGAICDSWLRDALIAALARDEKAAEAAQEEERIEEAQDAAPVVETEAVTEEKEVLKPARKSRRAREIAKLAAFGWLLLPGLVL